MFAGKQLNCFGCCLEYNLVEVVTSESSLSGVVYPVEPSGWMDGPEMHGSGSYKHNSEKTGRAG